MSYGIGICGPFGPVPWNAGNFGVTSSRHGLPLKTTVVAHVVEDTQPTSSGDIVLKVVRAQEGQAESLDVKGNVLYTVTYESINAKWAFSLRQGSSPEGPVLIQWQAPSRQSFFLQWVDSVEIECKRGLLIHKTFKAEFGPKKYEWTKKAAGPERSLECHINKYLAAICDLLEDQTCTARFEVKPAFRSDLDTIVASTLGVSEAEFGVDSKQITV